MMLGVAIGLALASAPPAAGEPASFGLVIGTNVSSDPDVQPLRYADDDAVQNARLLGELGAETVLLVQLDAETEALYPDLTATSPTRAAVRQALEQLNARIDTARAGGRSTALYLFYSGHGEVENNEGYVNLWDGRLYRRDLLELLRASHADQNHVIVDACKSYFLVFDRGAGGTRSPVAGPLVDEAAVPENTGVFLSTSAAADSHEWEAFGGGIFSHEVRSALRGAADQNRDGRVTYEEAGAFVWTANRAVPNPRFRPTVFSRPPAGSGSAVLIELSGATGDRLQIGPGVTSHLYVEDARGLRLADVRPAPDEEVVLLLPSRRPLFVRHPDSGRETEVPEGRRLVLAELATGDVTTARRGAEHVAFRELFVEPFGAASLVAYRARPAQAAVAAPPADRTSLRRSLGIGAAVLAAAGGTMTVLGVVEHESVEPTTPGLRRARVNERIDSYNIAAVTSYALAGAALAAYLTWTFWPEQQVEIEVVPGVGQVRVGVEF